MPTNRDIQYVERLARDTFGFPGYVPSHFDGTLNNTGTVAAPRGVLALAGGGTHTGTFSGQVSAVVAMEVSQDRISLDL